MSGAEIVSLISVFQTCIHGYRALSSFISGIKEMGHDVADLDNRIHEADTRLYAFGRIHNLVVRGNNDSVTNMPPYWLDAINSHMVQIKRHLDEAHTIVGKYRESPQKVASEAQKDQQADPDPVFFDLKRRPTESLSVALAQADYESRSQTLQGVTILKKLTWSLKEPDRLKHAVESLERENNSLFYLTIPQLGTLLYDAVASRLTTQEFRRRISRDIPKQTNIRPHKLEERMAELSTAREYVQQLRKETRAEKLERRLDISCFPDLVNAEFPEHRARHETNFQPEQRIVLVEWKEYDPENISRDEIIARVSDITAILNSPPTFMDNVLSSPGFFEDNRSNDKGTNWVGIVYHMSEIPYPYELRTLRGLLTRPEKPKGGHKEKGQEFWKPALGDRFKLALRLAQTLLSVHNCEWYHKGLRPENIVFFSRAKSIAEPHLLGWDYARAASTGQKTETVISWEADANLYQHPGWFAPSSSEDGSKFRLEYDQYQLGCLLLEIGSWKLLGDLKRYSNRTFGGEGWRESWRDYLVTKARKLDIEMGQIYSEVVVDLLLGLSADGQELEFWDAAVLRLSQCRV